MICKNCGSTMPEHALFCPGCGTKVVRESMPESTGAIMPGYIAPHQPAIPVQANHRRQKMSSKNLMLFICAGIVLCAAITAAVMYGVQLSKYNAAGDLLQEKDYARASEAFAAIEAFKDSKDMALYCRGLKCIEEGDYYEAIGAFTTLGEFKDSPSMVQYCKASAYMEEENYQDAQEAFNALGEFRDSADKAEYCQNALQYEIAATAMRIGDYEYAGKQFAALGDFWDSAQKAQECSDECTYQDAKALMDGGKFEAARALFDTLNGYKDSAEKSEYCANMTVYISAELDCKKELYYTAYKKFTSLGNFSDVSVRKYECVQGFPDTGVIYRNDEFKSSACKFYFKNTSEGACPYIIKIYSEGGENVAAIAVEPGKKASINLKAGNYIFKIALSEGNWYGWKEYFGDEGLYRTVVFADCETEVTNLERNYNYTWVLFTYEEELECTDIVITRDQF